jgi:hypothetical protein
MAATHLNDAPAHGSNQNASAATQLQCKYCQRPFTPKNSWQAYCTPEHKKALEKIITEMLSLARPIFIAAAEKLAAARTHER